MPNAVPPPPLHQPNPFGRCSQAQLARSLSGRHTERRAGHDGHTAHLAPRDDPVDVTADDATHDGPDADNVTLSR